MAPSTDEQFQFLLSCIRHSNHGKIDFTKVAKECSIVTRGAANRAKRYERLMKAHNINPNGGTADNPTTPVASPSPKKRTAGTKRNAGADNKDDGDQVDESAKKAKMMKEKAVESAEKLVAKNICTGIKEDPELFNERNVKVESGDY